MAAREAHSWPRYAVPCVAVSFMRREQLRDTTGDATHFHAASVSPDWAVDNGMERTAQIGNHIFYRQRSL